MGTILQDIRYAFRVLAKSPAFAIVAVLTLALGTGANTAIFQLINAVRLRSLPVKNPQTLAIVTVDTHDWGQGSFSTTYPVFTYGLWKQVEQRQEAFQTVAAWGGEGVNFSTSGQDDLGQMIWVTGRFFETLEIQPAIGRLISAADDQPGCAGGVNLSYSYWQRRYAGSPAAVGQTLTIEGHAFPILGVTQAGFEGLSVGESFDVAVPVCAEPLIRTEYSRVSGPSASESWWLAGIGRLKPGWTIAKASAQLQSITAAALHETVPSQYDAIGVKHYLAYELKAEPADKGFSQLRKDSSTPLWLLLGLSGVVLLIACANLANLMLARSTSREREVAVRRALGASPWRLARQLLAESAIIAIAGTLGGIFLASALSSALVAFLSTARDRIFLDTSTDWRVAGFAAALACLTTILFGLVPALRAARVPPGSVLKTGGRGMTAGRERFRLQRILVASQVAMSLVLLAGALLFARSLFNLVTLDTGFRQDGIVVFDVDYRRLNLPKDRREAFVRELLDRFRAEPGVVSAAASVRSPMGGWNSNDEVVANDSQDSRGVAFIDEVSQGYFHTLDITMLAGRDFNDSDTLDAPQVAIVNETFAKKFLGGKGGVGERFRLWQSPGKPEPFFTVVGVVRDATYRSLHDNPLAVVYFPRSQDKEPDVDVSFLIRSGIGTAALVNSVKGLLAAEHPELTFDVRVLREQILETLTQDRLMATLCAFFGALAVLLAAIGLYGVISYTIAQRTNEIGVRLALGAQRSDVVRLILREVSALIFVGIASGGAITLAAGKAAGSLLFHLKPRDPVTLGLAIAVLAAIGFAASFVPARRASRMDPMEALRYE